LTPVLVVAAVRQEGDYYWVCRRNSKGGHPELAGAWEYPGGKVEEGETLEEALEREMDEEFGVQVEIGKHLAMIETETWFSGGKRTRVEFFETVFLGTPELRCHDYACWCTVEEMAVQKHLPSGQAFNERLLHAKIPPD